MKRLGISIYRRAMLEQLLDYLGPELLRRSFSRIFSYLLSVRTARENVMRDFSLR